MPPKPSTYLRYVNPNGFQKMASFTLGPGGNDCVDLSSFTTQAARDDMKIPDSVSGVQWTIIDEQGEVMVAGNVGQGPLVLGGDFFGCHNGVVLNDAQVSQLAIFGSTSGGSTSGSSGGGGSGSGGSGSGGSGSGSSGNPGNSFGTGAYYTIRNGFGLTGPSCPPPCEQDCPPCSPPSPPSSPGPNSDPKRQRAPSLPKPPYPQMEAFSSGPIRFSDGKIMHTMTDISSSAGGIAWGHTRSYDNASYSSLEMRNGKRWMLDSIPFVNFFTKFMGASRDDEMVNITFTSSHSAYFERNGNTFIPYGRETATMRHIPGDKVYEVRRADGQTWLFHDYTDSTRQRGCLKSLTMPGGATLEMFYNSDKSPDKIRKTFVENGVTKLEEMVYSYVTCADNIKRIQYVTLRVSSNNGQSWTDLKRVKYDYYGNSENYGSVGDLKTVISQATSGGAWVDLGTMYYRYYKNGQTGGFQNGLKYIFEWADYAKLALAGTPFTMTDAQVAPYASNYFEYNRDNRPVLEKTTGGTHLSRITINTSTANDNPNYWWRKSTETFTNGTTKTVYTNTEGMVLLTIEPGSNGGNQIINHYVYDSQGRLIQHNTPEAIVSYQDNSGWDSYEGYRDYGYVPAISTTLKSNDGLIRKYQYYQDVTGQPDGYFRRETIQKGANGTPIPVKELEYTSKIVKNAQNQILQTIWLVSKSTQFNSENGTNPVSTLYSYDYETNSSKIIQKTTTIPAVSTTQNGAGTTATRIERYDAFERLVWSKDELGIITYHQYNMNPGVRVKTIQDVDTSKTSEFTTSVPSGWSTVSGAGKHLVTEFEYDVHGRVIQTLGPKNTTINASNQSISTRVASWVVYDDVNHTTRGASGYATLNTSGTVTGFVLNNPVTIVKRDTSGKVLEQIQAKRTSTSGKLLATDSFAQSSYVAWSKNIYNNASQLTTTRQYFLIPASGDGTKNVNYLETILGYDAMGRQNRVVSPDGTITRTVFDYVGNPWRIWVGTNDTGATDSNPKGSGNMVIVSETEYGGGAGCSTCCSAKNKPRATIQYESTSKMRVTEFGYDWRGRQTHIHHEEDVDGNMTYTVNTYDNLDRVVKKERFLLVPNTSSGGGNPPASSGSGGSGGTGSYHYSSSGGTAGTGNPKIDTNDPSDDRLLARAEQFYDERGRVWKQVQSIVNPATGAVTGKMQSLLWFDAAGRTIKSQGFGENHFTKTFYDSLGRATKSFISYDAGDTSYATATTVTGDTIFEQSVMTYDNLGNIILAASVERKVNQNATGELTLSTARFQYVANWFDPMGRQIATANYGTNGDATLTRPATVPARSDNVLITENFYDADTGRAFRTVDPAGKDQRNFFDAMGRTVKTIANYTGSGVISSSTPDQNVTIEMTYHPSGKVATMTAKNATTGDQVTRYVYGSMKTSVAPLIYRNDLLAAEIYPDSDDLENSSGILQNGTDNVADRVEFQYNRVGELIWRKDQNGSIHTYDFDNLGRVLHDRVTTLASGVDGTVRRVSTSYTVDGQISAVTSYNNATVGSGSVVNEVKYEYDSSGLLAKEYQNPSGSVTTSSKYVGYSYDATKSGEFFTKRLRPTSLRYPSATTINYVYGTSGSVDDKLNRFASVQNGSANVVTYMDTGLATPAIVKYPVPNLTLDYTASGALDRFGRVTDHSWKNSNGTALAQIKHGYDRVGNRLYREDVVAANASKSFDELYAYDAMNQLVDMQRGKLNSSKNAIASGKNFAEQFAFDATGNFATYKQDAAGDGTFELNQARTHTKANEIATIAGASTYTANDANGNMTKVLKPSSWSAAFNLVYDAWNRLVTVKDTNNTTLIAEYRYDGTNRRVLKKTYTSGTLSETREFCFNRNWQCVEEYVGSTCDTRYVWGLRYIDDLITYRKASTDYYSLVDPNWNVIAVTNTSGIVQERVTYDSFGKASFRDAAFTVRSTSNYAWNCTFTGQLLDPETGLMLYRNRFYHPTLGRFVQRDPIGYEAQDVSLYRYVGNMVAKYIDPFGFAPRRRKTMRPQWLDNIVSPVERCACSAASYTGKCIMWGLDNAVFIPGAYAIDQTHDLLYPFFYEGPREKTCVPPPPEICSVILDPCFSSATGCLCGAIGIIDDLANFAPPGNLQFVLGALDCLCGIISMVSSTCAAGNGLTYAAATLSVLAESAGCAWNIVTNITKIGDNFSNLQSAMIDLATWIVGEGSTAFHSDIVTSCASVKCNCF